MIGRKLGPYRITARLGRGGMGEVYLAEAPDRLRPVAVKVLDPSLAEEAGVFDRFLREATLLSRLDHPNIVRLLDAPATEEGTTWFVMEYLEGKTVREILAALGSVDPRQAVCIVLDVLAGLACAHGAGVVHRDLKPGNVIIKRSGKAKLTDFGLGLFQGATRFTASGQVFGTPAYMSPEQARGEDVTASSDLYATGVLLYEMLCGRPPFSADHPLVLMRKIVEDAAPHLSELRGDLPEALCAHTMRALSKDSSARFPSAEAMREALEAVEFPEGLDTVGETVQTLVEQDTAGVVAVPKKKRRWVIWIPGLILLALALPALSWWLGSGETGGGEDADDPSGVEAPEPKDRETTALAETAEPARPPSGSASAGIPGSRVRLVLRSGEEVEGELLSGDPESVTIRDEEGNKCRFGYEEIRRIVQGDR